MTMQTVSSHDKLCKITNMYALGVKSNVAGQIYAALIYALYSLSVKIDAFNFWSMLLQKSNCR